MINSNIFLAGFSLEEKKEQLCHDVILFVYSQLPLWRDDKTRKRETSEEPLNSQLCKFLNTSARRSEESFFFNNEEPQGARRKVDISVSPYTDLLPNDLYPSPYETITVFEAKRLPAPSSGREKEYILSADGHIGGGIQRFKLGLHGASYNLVGMIGYIQNDDANTCFLRINKWLDELAGTISDDTSWSPDEKLQKVCLDASKRIWHGISRHTRTNLGAVTIHHLWVEMSDDSREK